MASRPGGLAHDALLYASDGELRDTLVPFLRDGIAAGDAAVVVSTPRLAERLRHELGRDTGAVTFADAGAWYRRPERALLNYRQALDRRPDGGASGVRVVGEVPFGDSPAEQRSWVRYEAMLNTVFADASAWIVCPYDARALPPALLEGARRTHPHLLRRGGRSRSRRYSDPRALLRALPEEPHDLSGAVLLAELTVADGELAAAGGLARARGMIRGSARRSGLGHDRVEDLVLAGNEALTNAVTHGRRPVLARLWLSEGSVVCEVNDAGRGCDDPVAGYVPPRPRQHPVGGMGLWLARHLCDFVELDDAGNGFTVRLGISL